jgi:hypothetical protein
MKPIPPFVANSPDDTHCVNAVFRMVLMHFGKQDMTWEEIDAKTKSIPGRGTWTIGGDIVLAKRGIKVTNIEPVDYDALYKEGVSYLQQVFGADTSKYYLERSNIAAVIPDIPEFLRLVPHETRRAETKEIITFLQNDNLVGVTLNSGILNNKSGFMLHYVLLYDFDGTHFSLHDPGLPPQPSRSISLETFEKSFVYHGGNGGIEIFGQ